MSQKNKHIWQFSLVGGVKRVNIETGDDLLNLGELDQKLWTALSCPTEGLEIDPKTLSLIDVNGNGQIRVKDILNAVEWVTSLLKNPDDLFRQESALPLSAIQTETEEGKRLLSSAKTILKNLNKPEAETISVEDTADTTAIFASTRFNGDGVITEDSASDLFLQQLIQKIVACIGGVPDRGGKQGIDTVILLVFFEACRTYDAWLSKAENEPALYMPYGKDTTEAYRLFTDLKYKLDDFFLRCKMMGYDRQSADVLNNYHSGMEKLVLQELNNHSDEISKLPLAKANAEMLLPLDSGVNPAWQEKVQRFKQLMIEPALGDKDSINESDWKTIQSKFISYKQWLNEKAGEPVEPLGADNIREILKMNAEALLTELIEKDKALESEANNIILVDQMVRYYRDMIKLLKNFVTFYDFYTPGMKAIFQAGTLYIDQRSCELCIQVQNLDKHHQIASLSGLFLVYCECISRKDGETMIIAAAITNGDIDNLEAGRNALFYDRNGNDWDATVISVIENPVSIQQAFWMPYRRVSRFVGKQINKFASTQDNKVHEKSMTTVEKTHETAEEELHKNISTSNIPAPAKAEAPPAPPFDIGKFVGIFAAISLAMGAIGTAIAAIVGGFLALDWWKIPFAFGGIILAISGPSMILAYIRLRKRNLAPLLDANGWAVNANVIINIPFGVVLTSLAQLPDGAKINLDDPFMQKKRPLLKIGIAAAVFILLVLFFMWKMNMFQWLF